MDPTVWLSLKEVQYWNVRLFHGTLYFSPPVDYVVKRSCFVCLCAIKGELYEAVYRPAAAGPQLSVPQAAFCLVFLL